MGRTMRSRGASSYRSNKRSKRGNKLSRRLSKRRVKRTTKRSNKRLNKRSNRPLNRKSFKRAFKRRRNNRKSYGGNPYYTIRCTGVAIHPSEKTEYRKKNVYYYKIEISHGSEPSRYVYKRWSEIRQFEKDIIETYHPSNFVWKFRKAGYREAYHTGLEIKYFRVNDTPEDKRNDDLRRRMKNINSFFGNRDPDASLPGQGEHYGVSQWINQYKIIMGEDLIEGNSDNPVKRFFRANNELSSFLDDHLIPEL